MIEGCPTRSEIVSRRVYPIDWITISGSPIFPKDGVREVFPTNEDACSVFVLIVKGIDLITIGRVFNPDHHCLKTSIVDIVVSKKAKGSWVAGLYVDVGVKLADLEEIYRDHMLGVILGKFGFTVSINV